MQKRDANKDHTDPSINPHGAWAHKIVRHHLTNCQQCQDNVSATIIFDDSPVCRMLRNHIFNHHSLLNQQGLL